MNSKKIEKKNKIAAFQKIHTDARGFSLIELLIVMVILGLIASLVGPRMFGKLGMAKQHTAKTQIELLMRALDSYRIDMGAYPAAQDGLEALVEDPGDENWQGPYLDKGVPPDPWGNAYIYENPAEDGGVSITSYGMDGQPGGEGENADIVWGETGKWN